MAPEHQIHRLDPISFDMDADTEGGGDPRGDVSSIAAHTGCDSTRDVELSNARRGRSRREVRTFYRAAANKRAAVRSHDQAPATNALTAPRSSPRSRAGKDSSRSMPAARRVPAPVPGSNENIPRTADVALERLGDLGQARMPGDHRERAGGRTFRGYHAERLVQDRRHDEHIHRGDGARRVAMVEAPGEDHVGVARPCGVDLPSVDRSTSMRPVASHSSASSSRFAQRDREGCEPLPI